MATPHTSVSTKRVRQAQVCMWVALSTLVLALVTLGGCFTTSDHTSTCWGLQRTEKRCVYQTSGVEGYECSKLKRVIYDDKTLPADQVVFDCREPDTESTIQIIRPDGEACDEHFVCGRID